jgi:hypothetical protein
MSRSLRTLPAALVAMALAALALAPGAQAANGQESIFQDDQSLLLGSSGLRESSLTEMASLGVDTIHSLVFWNNIAPAADQLVRPAGFDARNPAAYPAGSWDALDDLVRGTNVRGMQLLLSPSAPIPGWASDCKTKSIKSASRCRPNPTQFKRFVMALGSRYSGAYADENQGGGVLPRVSRWSVWNEPNQGSWLRPQYVKKGHRVVPVSPGLYRNLVNAMVKALKDTGHGDDQILLGETAPLGRRTGTLSTRPIPPLNFYRSLFCLGGAKGCKGRFGVNGISHHPYTRGGSQRPTTGSLPGEITLQSASRLKRVLAQAASRHRIKANLPIYYTEYGFQTNPPDDTFGLPLTTQATYLNQADWMSWRDKRVKGMSQYELRDDPDLAEFQTGLRFADGSAKPSLEAYRTPIWVTKSGRSHVHVFGQVRPAKLDKVSVTIQRATKKDAPFETVRTVNSGTRGFVYRTVQGRGGVWRLVWTDSDGTTYTSRNARVSAR